MASALLNGDSSTSAANDTATLDLLQRLQQAIFNGQDQLAAMAATELAKMRANCSMTIRRSEIQFVNDDMLVKEPIRVQVQATTTISDVENQIYQKYKVPIRDRCVVLLETTSPPRESAESIGSFGAFSGTNSKNVTEAKEKVVGEEWSCSVCTYINVPTQRCCAICDKPCATSSHSTEITPSNPKVAPMTTSSPEVAEFPIEEVYSNYQELLDMENTDLVTNLDAFECPVCMTVYHPGDGVVLKTCLHSFCRDCLSRLIETSSDAEIRCPYVEDYMCGKLLQDREIRALVRPEVYDRYLTISMNEAESKMANTFHCKTADCTGWCEFEDDVNVFWCPVCCQNNCLTCQAIHLGMNCAEYQRKIQVESANDPEARKTLLHLEEMLKEGKGMTCPTCRIIILKKSGCDAIICTMCKTEICWVTKGPRWGPRGRGDTSGGCGCSYQKRCHPNCGNCH